MNYGLKEETLAEIRRVLARHPEIERAVLYGSRAKGTCRLGSDVDLVLVGAGLDGRTLSQIAEAFEESTLPYRFDLSVLHRIRHPALLEHIERVGVPLYEREPAVSRAHG